MRALGIHGVLHADSPAHPSRIDMPRSGRRYTEEEVVELVLLLIDLNPRLKKEFLVALKKADRVKEKLLERMRDQFRRVSPKTPTKH